MSLLPRYRGGRCPRACALLFLLAVLGTACARTPGVPRILVLERFQPASREGVFLNEDLVFTFSSELDRDSVTADSFQVVDDEGRPARGRRIVQGRVLRFQPAPVLRSDLQGGGYRPGTTYRVLLAGFPSLGAIRDVEGAPLPRSEDLPFRTVSLDGPESDRGPVFDDASPGQSQVLRIVTQGGRDREGWTLFPGDPIWLTCEEPLDPSTLRDEDFELLLLPDPMDLVPGVEEPPRGRPIDVRARFVTNYDEGEAPPGEPCARIELVPAEELNVRDSLRLTFAFDLALRDFGGNPVWRPSPEGTARGTKLIVRSGPGQPLENRLAVEFDDASRFITVRVPGADGTAIWGHQGTVGVRYPLSAGTGADKKVSLGERLEDRDVNAVRMELGVGKTCELPVGGLVVLRSQGTLRIAGELTRRATASKGTTPEDLYRIDRQDLSQWLEARAAAADEWTVLIAGGDLVIEDEGIVDVETPLLLVAGGRVRAAGSIRNVPPNQLWFLGRGGSIQFGLTHISPNLVIDTPLMNPLAVPLRFAAVSSQIPRSQRSVRWNNPVVSGHEGNGSYRVRYLLADSDSWDPMEAVDHPRLLDGEGPIRLLVEFDLPEAEFERLWDPPWIDSIQLSWEPLEEGR